MGPSQHFRSSPRGGVSELYASVLMVGVTLTVGGLVASSALGQFAMANDSASLGAATQEASAGIQIGLVYLATTTSRLCPVYGGYHEGTTIEIAVYNYGGTAFIPEEIILNGTLYAGKYTPLSPGSLGTYAITMSTCSHFSGQTVILVDSAGDEVQFES